MELVIFRDASVALGLGKNSLESLLLEQDKFFLFQAASQLKERIMNYATAIITRTSVASCFFYLLVTSSMPVGHMQGICKFLVDHSLLSAFRQSAIQSSLFLI